MEPRDQKTEMMKGILELLDGVVTREEFTAALEKVVQAVQDLRGQTDQEIATMRATLDRAIEDTKGDITNGAELTKQELRDLLDEHLSASQFRHEAMLAEANDKMDNMKDGKDADEERVIGAVLARIPVPEEPEDDTPEDVRDALETLEGDERLDVSAIKGITEQLDAMKKEIGRLSKQGGGIVASQRGRVSVYDLSDRLDGVTKAFSLPSMWKIISVQMTSTPIVLRPTVDYTWVQNTITFTDEIDAATSLQAGQSVIIIYAEN